MKWGLHLRTCEARAPPPYAGKFLAYKQLKKMISYTAAGDAGSRANFFLALADELERVSRLWERQARAVKRARAALEWRARAYQLLLCFAPKLAARQAKREGQALYNEVWWCRQYAQLNAVGLRKILKKFDRRLGGREGAAFLQACWRGDNLRQGTVLHSPLLHDLLALEAWVVARCGLSTSGRQELSALPPSLHSSRASLDEGNEKGGGGGDAWREGGNGGGGAWHEGDGGGGDEGGDGGGASSDESEHGDVQLTCPICMCPMFHPIGLACGHTFCERCVIQHARLTHLLGPLKRVLERAPPDVACPECRQGCVFDNALPLRELDELVKLRHPDEWQEQAAERWSHKQSLLRRFLQQRFQQRSGSFNATPPANHGAGSGGVGSPGGVRTPSFLSQHAARSDDAPGPAD